MHDISKEYISDFKNKKTIGDQKSTVIILDTNSYRGSDEELKQTGVMNFVQNK